MRSDVGELLQFAIGASQFLDFFRQIVYGALSLIAQPLFLKGAQHCHGQARQPVFENIIHSALLDAFDRADVAESSGDQNQRDVQLFIAQNVQRFQSPPLGEVVVGEHYLVRVGSYSRGKFFFCFDNIHGEIEPAAAQFPGNQFNVSGVVLY